MEKKQNRIREHSVTAWLTETEAANRLNISKKLLQKWRLRGGPLRYAKFGSAVRYSVADIEAFETDSLRVSTSDQGPCGSAR